MATELLDRATKILNESMPLDRDFLIQAINQAWLRGYKFGAEKAQNNTVTPDDLDLVTTRLSEIREFFPEMKWIFELAVLEGIRDGIITKGEGEKDGGKKER